MCGICGIADPREAVDPGRLSHMSDALRHRGPDSDGARVDGAVGLAARRLAIIDLEHGDQPIASEDGSVVVVQNGEIYNHRQLRQELEAAGHVFATGCDTEVLVHLYEQEGDDFVHRLRGMFAIAVWDRRRQRLLLARDPFGIKPLYWRHVDGVLSFASELKALVRQPSFSREVDLAAVEAFLAFNMIPAPLTAFREARKLPPGHLLVWSRGSVDVRRWSRPAPAAHWELRPEPIEELAEELRERLRDSVRAHLVSDVPVGVLLSGGIDSSIVTALASAETGAGIKTFSIGFEERAFDELDLARQVAARHGTDHHELILRPDAVTLLPEITAAFDEPFADSSAVPTYLVCRLAAEHVKVVLSGEGGDELFGGYHTYTADLLAERVGSLARLAHPLVSRLPAADSGAVSLRYKLERFTRAAHLPALERHHGWKEIFSADARAELLGGRRSGRDVLAVHRERFAETESSDLLARLQDVDVSPYLADDLLVKTDRMSMAHSLEARVPFLDPVVAELALALPRAMKVHGLTKKRLLRQAAAPLVPRAVVHGRKRGFSMPAARWLRGELRPLARELLSPSSLARHGWLEPSAVQEVLDAHMSGSRDHSRQLWGLMCFALWDPTAGAPEPSPGAGLTPGTARA